MTISTHSKFRALAFNLKRMRCSLNSIAHILNEKSDKSCKEVDVCRNHGARCPVLSGNTFTVYECLNYIHSVSVIIAKISS